MDQELMTIQGLVKKEASKLKEYATQEELARLNFEHLNPNSPRSCIYGQMTGNCYSPRANELVLKCAERVYISSINSTSNSGAVFSYQTLNGEPHAIVGTKDRSELYHSPIEIYLVFNRENDTTENNKILIDYLKNVTTELNFAEAV